MKLQHTLVLCDAGSGGYMSVPPPDKDTPPDKGKDSEMADSSENFADVSAGGVVTTVACEISMSMMRNYSDQQYLMCLWYHPIGIVQCDYSCGYSY